MSDQQSSTSADFEVTGEPEFNWRNEVPSNISEFLKMRGYDDIKNFIDNTTNFDAKGALLTTGPLAGYTALHFACMERNNPLLNILISNYNADVNAVADDGIQPIHLAVLFDVICISQDLLTANLDPNIEITKDIYLKYKQQGKWSNDFGNSMTLLTFAIFNDRLYMATDLMHHGADISMRTTINNKTLLMYAFENYQYEISLTIIDYMATKNPELIDACDDKGLHAFHYLMGEDRYGDCRYDENLFFWAIDQLNALDSLIRVGADIYATVNGDPDTLLINLAAYRSCYPILREFLPRYSSIVSSKALRNDTLPVGDLDKYFQKIFRNFDSKQRFKNHKKLCTEIVLMDLVNRSAFDLHVPKEEIEVMDHLIATDSNISKFVDDYKISFIEKTLKQQIITYGDKSITYYEVAKRTFNNRLLKVMVKDIKLIEAVKSAKLLRHPKQCNFNWVIIEKIRRAEERNEFLDEFKKISHLRDALPLPYEVVLLIIEFLNNKDLKRFIDVFYDI